MLFILKLISLAYISLLFVLVTVNATTIEKPKEKISMIQGISRSKDGYVTLSGKLNNVGYRVIMTGDPDPNLACPRFQLTDSKAMQIDLAHEGILLEWRGGDTFTYNQLYPMNLDETVVSLKCIEAVYSQIKNFICGMPADIKIK